MLYVSKLTQETRYIQNFYFEIEKYWESVYFSKFLRYLAICTAAGRKKATLCTFILRRTNPKIDFEL